MLVNDAVVVQRAANVALLARALFCAPAAGRAQMIVASATEHQCAEALVALEIFLHAGNCCRAAFVCARAAGARVGVVGVGSVTVRRVVVIGGRVVRGRCVHDALPVHGQMRNATSGALAAGLKAHVDAVNGKLTA